MSLRRILLVSAAVALVSSAARAGDDSHSILESIRRKVAEQVARSANYACVETIDRHYYQSTRPSSAGCEAVDRTGHREIIRDRLRLNVAVSEGGEIFSWHGQRHFSTKNIDSIVHGGPISSGGFVGFLRNIFVSPGVAFTYLGRSAKNGTQVVRFEYSVAKRVSQYRIQGGENKSALVPFHGSFSANASTFELIRLAISSDSVPAGVSICKTDLDVRYQMSVISGKQRLIPRSYELSIEDNAGVYTASRGEYNDCHEFRAESTLRFDVPGKTPDTFDRAGHEQSVPADSLLRVALKTPIDSKTTFTGDLVEASLTEPVVDGNGATVIPQSASVYGVITQLETFYQPQPYTCLRIEFDRASFGETTYLMRAVHLPTGKETNTALSIFDGLVPKSLEDDVETGTVIFRTDHLKLNQKFHGDWRTTSLPTRDRVNEN